MGVSLSLDFEYPDRRQGNKLIFDNLSIGLPDGVTVEVKTPDSIYDNGKKMQIIELNGAEDDEEVDLIQDTIRERHWRDEYYNAIMLWADEVDGETVVSVMCQTSLEDFEIVGYVVSGSECKEVYEISAAAMLGVKQIR